MTKILFVCHGNICRSPMAECIMKKIVKDNGKEKDFVIESAATSTEEIGNCIHPGAKQKLEKMCIPIVEHVARQITEEDYQKYDIIIGMDVENLFRMQRLWNKDPNDKIKLLLTYVGKDKDIEDPWYTHNFDETYDEILIGCKALFESLK